MNLFGINNIFHPLTITIALIIIGFFIFFIGYMKGAEDRLEKDRKSKKWSRSVLGGVFSEQVAPFLPDFPKDLKASEARFIGKPIDFLIFKGMDEQNIEEVVFVEIKSGKSQLTTNERKLRDVINNKKVSWYEYRVDGEITTFSEDSIASKEASNS
jgi:predicted Holliday junction resolvase-like endonuclease